MRLTRLFTSLCATLIALTACLEDHLPDAPKTNQRLTVAAAKMFFETSVANTRTSFSDNPGITPGDFAPKWEQAQYTADTLIESVDVPILSTFSYRLIFTTQNKNSGNLSTRSLPVYQKLIVVRDSHSENMGCFIMNLIPDKEYQIRNRSALLKKVFNGNFADFSGIVLYSQLKGNRTVRVDRYCSGRKFQAASVFDESLSLEQVESRMRAIMQNASAKKAIHAVTRSESGGGFEGGTLPPVDVWPDPELPPVDPNPGEITPPDFPNPGGGGGGGGQTPDKPKPSITPARISAAAKLAVAAYKKDEYKNSDGKWIAMCNKGVREAFYSIFKSTELDNKNANSIVKYWQTSSKWERTEMSKAQNLANEGYFVTAGWINPMGGSGHVVVVVPGTPMYGNWNNQYVLLPNVMDTGYEKRKESQLINWSFGKPKHSGVEFYRYKE